MMTRRMLKASLVLGAHGLATMAGCSGPGDSKLQEQSVATAASAFEALVVSQAPGSVLPTEVGANGRAAGFTAGGAGVSATGAATYSIPLWTPPGRAGIEPSLALTYSSQAGEGLAGQGWNLSGLSRITRCGKSLAQDNFNDAVHFDNTLRTGDRFCLDGRRLVAVSGEYGAEGTEYRVESGGFEKVVSLGVAGTEGPRTFKVFGKDGTVRTYGEMLGQPHALFDGQRVHVHYDEVHGTYVRDASQHVVYAWGLSRVEDTSGNYLVVSYSLTGDSAVGYEWLPTGIYYTASTKGLSAQREVQLEYEPVPQPGTSWIAGLQTRTSQRLKRVKAIGPGLDGAPALLKRYELTYRAQAAGEEVSLLDAVEECDGAGVCLEPVVFDYGRLLTPPAQEQVFSLGSSASNIVPPYQVDCHVGDIDGDGFDDVLYRKHDGVHERYYYRLSEHGHLGPETLAVGLPVDMLQGYLQTTPNEYYRRLFSGEGNALVDIDGDGRAEFVGTWYEYKWSSDYQLQQWAGNVMLRSAPGATPGSIVFQGFYGEHTAWPRAMAGWRFADLDGDGQLEYVGYDAQMGQMQYQRYQDGTMGPRYSLGHYAHAAADTGFMVTTPARDNRAALGTGNHFVSVFNLGSARVGYDGPFREGERSYVADVNGDGLEDMLVAGFADDQDREHSCYIDVSINTGAGYDVRHRVATGEEVHGIAYDAALGHLKVVSDTNGNGRDEIAVSYGAPHYELDRSGALVVAPGAVKEPYTAGRDIITGDLNGDGVADSAWCHMNAQGGVMHVQISSVPSRPVLVSATKGHVSDHFAYDHTGNPEVYEPGSPNVAPPLVARHRGVWVATHHERVQTLETPIPGPNPYQTVASVAYTYGGSLADAHGRGWLGFALRTVHDELTGAVTTTTSRLGRKVGSQYVTAGLPELEMTEVTVGGVRHSTSRTHTYNFVEGPPGIVRLASSSVTERQCQAPAGGDSVCDRQVETSVQLDAYGNTTKVSAVVRWEWTGNPAAGNGYAKSATTTLTNTYEPPDTARWLVARPKRTIVERTDPEARYSQSTTDFITDPQTGLLNAVLREPDSTDPAIKLMTYTGYSPYGLPIWVRSQDTGSLVRYATTEYDAAEGMYPVKVEGGGNKTLLQYHRGLGLLMRREDTHGIATTYSYDGFGRPRKVDAPHEGDETFSYQARTDGGLTVTRSRVAGGELRTEVDALGRPFRARTLQANGTAVYVDTMYDDVLGLSVRTSLPYAEGETRKFARREADVLGRVLKVTRADGAFATYGYPSLLKAVTTDEMNRRHHTTVDGRGLVLETDEEDPATGYLLPTRFTYGPRAEVLSVVREKRKGNGSSDWVETKFEYDDVGRRTRTVEPDRGPSSTTYNAFGEVATVTDNRGTTTYSSRDSYGRPVHVDTPEGPVGYLWDVNSQGQLASSLSADGVTTTYLYDGWGRASTTRWKVGQESFDVTTTYDAYGRPDTLAYPAVGGERLVVRQDYDAVGRPALLSNAADGTVYWRALQRNAAGQLLQEQRSNGVSTSYAYDLLGRLRFIHAQTAAQQTVQKLAFAYAPDSSMTERHDLLMGTSEDFSYDYLDRLTGWKVTQGGKVSEEAYDYDDLGNLTGRRILAGPGHTSRYDYGTFPAQPHALMTFTQPFLGKVRTPTYDVVGNQTGDGLGRTIEFTSFDLPKRVLKDGNEVAQYTYDAAGARVRKHLANGDETLTIAGGLYERRTTADVRTHVFTLQAGGHPLAQVHWREGSGGNIEQRTVYFQHTDAAGTASTLTDANGAEVTAERLKLDPWGARRNTADVGLPYTGPLPSTQRGFQDHALDAESDLVNMKGRMYDAAMGAFLTPDPIVTGFFAGQAHNPYRFGRNNPLKYADPSGYTPEISGQGPYPNWDGNISVVAVPIPWLGGGGPSDSCRSPGQCTSDGIPLAPPLPYRQERPWQESTATRNPSAPKAPNAETVPGRGGATGGSGTPSATPEGSVSSVEANTQGIFGNAVDYLSTVFSFRLMHQAELAAQIKVQPQLIADALKRLDEGVREIDSLLDESAKAANDPKEFGRLMAKVDAKQAENERVLGYSENAERRMAWLEKRGGSGGLWATVRGMVGRAVTVVTVAANAPSAFEQLSNGHFPYLGPTELRRVKVPGGGYMYTDDMGWPVGIAGNGPEPRSPNPYVRFTVRE